MQDKASEKLTAPVALSDVALSDAALDGVVGGCDIAATPHGGIFTAPIKGGSGGGIEGPGTITIKDTGSTIPGAVSFPGK
jgi:hypothetical protein